MPANDTERMGRKVYVSLAAMIAALVLGIFAASAGWPKAPRVLADKVRISFLCYE